MTTEMYAEQKIAHKPKKMRKPCDECGKKCFGALCLGCYNATRGPAAAWVDCSRCGLQTRSQAAICRDCAYVQRTAPNEATAPLTGGRWVPRPDGVRVWVEVRISPVDNAFSVSAPQATMSTAKNEAARTADRDNGQHWSGPSRHPSAKNGRD